MSADDEIQAAKSDEDFQDAVEEDYDEGKLPNTVSERDVLTSD